MSTNLEIWDKVSRPPASALKTIQAGRLKGMTDVNPQWRIKVMTEVFGPIGEGWYYDIIKFWNEPGSNGELMAFAHIHLFTRKGEGWSAPISGIGGSALVAKESAGLRANDEAYKMAVTDALSVAMKQLGVAADIYAGLWDGSKYKDEPKKSEVDTSPSLPMTAEQVYAGLNKAAAKGNTALTTAIKRTKAEYLNLLTNEQKKALRDAASLIDEKIAQQA